MVTPEGIQVRRGYFVGANGFRDRFWIVEQSKQVGTRQHAAQGLDHLFPAPHAQQPVMNDRNPHVLFPEGHLKCLKRQVATSNTTPRGRFAERLYPLGYPVIVETDDPQMAAVVNTLWGDWPQLVSGEPLKVSIVGKLPDPGPDHGERFRVTPTGFRLNGLASAAYHATFLATPLHLEIQGNQFSEHFLNTALLTALDFSLFTPFHAACVVRNGLGVALCGDSGAGKSTLAYACARRGWTLISDDSVHLLPGVGSIVASFSSTIHLREPARALFSELQRECLTVAPNGKPAFEIQASGHGFRTARTACVERIIFLSRRPGPPQLTALDLNAAEQYFLKYLWQPDLQAHQLRLHEVAADTGATLLEYDRVDEAVDALEGLLKEEGMAA